MIVCTEHDVDVEITETTAHGYKGICPVDGHDVEVLGW